MKKLTFILITVEELYLNGECYNPMYEIPHPVYLY